MGRLLLDLPDAPFLVLAVTTTFPLVYLVHNSFYTINLSMPFLDGFAGPANYAQMLGDARREGGIGPDFGRRWFSRIRPAVALRMTD